MRNPKRKIHFLLFSMCNKEGKILENSEIEQRFKNVTETRMQTVPGTERKATSVEFDNTTCVIELVRNDGHLYFLRMGVYNPSSFVALRNTSTLATNDIPMTQAQALETFTYCLIDFETGIVSYVSSTSAPKIGVLGHFMKEFIEDSTWRAVLSVIYSPDVLRAALRKKRFTSLSVDIAVPNDTVLSEKLGIDEKTFDGLMGRKTCTVNYTIKADRKMSLHDNPTGISRIIQNVINKIGYQNINQLNIWGKDDEDVSAQKFNLLSMGITKTATVLCSEYDNASEQQQLSLLETAYNQSRVDILSYIQ